MIIRLTTTILMFDFVDFGAGRPKAVRHAFGPHPADQNRASLAFGGDHNLERWPEEVWAEDAELMRIAGVNLATVGLFPCAGLDPAEGRYEFGWLNRAPDPIASAGVRVDLATGIASPPPWFSASYPQALPVDADGGGRPCLLMEHLTRPVNRRAHNLVKPPGRADTRILREVCAPGADLRALAEVTGGAVATPPVAILLNYESLWAARLLGDAGLANLTSYMDGGGTLVAEPFVAVVDKHDHVRPGRTDELLGVAAEEVLPLPVKGTAALADGTSATVWTKSVHLRAASAEVTHVPDAMAGYPDGLLAGAPAITGRRAGTGSAWCLTARLDEPGLARGPGRILDAAAIVRTVPGLPSTTEIA
jgi:beta-galactosidase GanA